jgi:Uma2 family endonuclease
MINLLEEESMTVEEFIHSKFYADGCWELMRGELVAMSPARVSHEVVSARLVHLFSLLIRDKNKRCIVGTSNAAVLHNNDSFVMPDLFVSCDPSRIDENERFKTAPEIVVEVLSKRTKRYDTTLKLALYKDAGACEYWIVDIENSSVVIEDFVSNKRVLYTHNDVIFSGFLGTECFRVKEVFDIGYKM